MFLSCEVTNFRKGDAGRETANWYTNYNEKWKISSDYPWIVRGGGYWSGYDTLFNYDNSTGSAERFMTFRVVVPNT